MMETKFTPGPWRLIGAINGEDLFVRIFASDPSPESNRELQIIGLEDSHPVKEHNERRLADMKLITAAPDLYEALTGKEEDPHLYAINWLATLLRVCKKEEVLNAIIKDQGGDTDSVLIMLGELDALVKNGNEAILKADS